MTVNRITGEISQVTPAGIICEFMYLKKKCFLLCIGAGGRDSYNNSNIKLFLNKCSKTLIISLSI